MWCERAGRRLVATIRQQLRAFDPATSQGSDVEVVGWVKSKRVHKNCVFLDVTDGSNVGGVQVVLGSPPLVPVVTGCSVVVRGRFRQSPKGVFDQPEILGTNLEVVGGVTAEYPLPKKSHTVDYLRECTLFRGRSPMGATVLRIRSVIAHEIDGFFDREGFVQIHAPVLTANDCEGNNEVFQLRPQPNGKHFFSTPVFLTVSGQLEAELFCHALKNVYSFGPTFRAENSNTRRHLSEFWMLEPEMAFTDRQGAMEIGESRHLLEHYEEELTLLARCTGQDLLPRLQAHSSSPFAIVTRRRVLDGRPDGTYDEAIRILEKCSKTFEIGVKWEDGLAFEHENYLSSTVFQRPVFVTDYPKALKPFYMKENEDGRTVKCMDLLVPHVGELLGGSERENRYEALFPRMESLKLLSDDYIRSQREGSNPPKETMGERLNWYLELRRQGSVPSSGWGIGYERLLLYLLGFDNVRDVIPVPRTPGHCHY